MVLIWQEVNCTSEVSTAIATVPGGMLVRCTTIPMMEGQPTSVALCFVPAIPEKEEKAADFKAWLESERRRESERFNTVTNDQPAIDVADPDAM